MFWKKWTARLDEISAQLGDMLQALTNAKLSVSASAENIDRSKRMIIDGVSIIVRDEILGEIRKMQGDLSLWTHHIDGKIDPIYKRLFDQTYQREKQLEVHRQERDKWISSLGTKLPSEIVAKIDEIHAKGLERQRSNDDLGAMQLFAQEEILKWVIDGK